MALPTSIPASAAPGEGAHPERRICVIGTSGSGKTYVAERLAERLGLRYISNDAIEWRAHWEQTPRKELLPAYDAATRDGGWTFDGNIGPWRSDQLVLSRCDTVVWLDLPRWQVTWAIAMRTFRRALTRQPLWHGNVEGWRMALSRDSMIVWAWKTFAQRRRQYAALFADPAHAQRQRIRLRSRGETNRWLATIDVAEWPPLSAQTGETRPG